MVSKIIGIAIIGITIAYIFILTIGRIIDNTKRDDRNYSRFTQTHDNSKWNEETTASDKAKKADSLTDHLFGPQNVNPLDQSDHNHMNRF